MRVYEIEVVDYSNGEITNRYTQEIPISGR